MDMEQKQIVVVGGGYAGVLAALRIAGRARDRASVTLVSGSPVLVERIRLHEVAAGRRAPVHSLEELVRGTGIRLEIMQVERLDPVAKEVVGPRSIPYDLALLATGSTADEGAIRGLSHAHTLASVESAQALGARIAAVADGGRVVVVGGGLTGIELATELAESYPRLRVALVSPTALGAALSEGAASYLRATFDALAIATHEHTRVEEIHERGVLLADGTDLPADVVAWAGGMRPSDLARKSGLSVSARGQMLVDATLRSISHPDVFGAGDAVALAHGAGAHIRMGCASAMPMGAHAADGLAAIARGGEPAPYGFGFLVQCMSLGRKRGLVQRVDALDRPLPGFFHGRFGATLKELVCRFTVQALRLERRWPGAYRWPRMTTPLVPVPRLPLPESV